MADLHPQAPIGSQLQVGAVFERNHFVPGGAISIFRRVKTASGFQADRPRVRNENMDPSRQMIPGVNVEAIIAPKFDLMADVDSMLPFRVHQNGAYVVTGPLGTSAGAGTVATNGTRTITGTGTAFDATYIGKFLFVTGEPVGLKVIAVASATSVTVATAATTTASGLLFAYSSLPVYRYDMHRRTPVEAAPALFVDALGYEITDGDGYPVRLVEVQQQELKIKITKGKIVEVSETWMACYDTYISEATVTRAVSSYAATPTVYGHFSTVNSAKLPLHARVFNAAGSGFDGKLKFAFTRTPSGTVTTAGSTAVVGSGTHFLTDLTAGDAVYIATEPSPLFVSTITDDTHLTLTSAASTSTAGLTFTAATFSGTAIPFSFDIATQVNTLGPGANGGGVGIDAFDDVWITLSSGNGTVSVGDEWTFTEPRTLAVPIYSRRDVLTAAGFKVLIDGMPFGGTPGFTGFEDAEITLTCPKVANMTTGSKHAAGILSNGRDTATISFTRYRVDRTFLKKVINAQSLQIVVNMIGQPFADTGYDEQWQIVFNTCEVNKDPRDVTTENALQEKIDINATRGPNRSLSGTVTTNGTAFVVGSGTAFDTELSVGDEVYIVGEPAMRTVKTIPDATHVTLTDVTSTSASTLTASAVSPIWVESIWSTRPSPAGPIS